MIKITSKILLLSLAIFTPLAFLFAESSNAINNPIGPSNMDINQLVVELLKIVAQLGAIVCVFFIIYAGFLFVKARGNEAEVTKAKSVLLWSVVGAAVLLGASAIAEVIKGYCRECY